MSNWILGREVPYFKPIRNEFTREFLNKLEIETYLKEEGWTKDSIIDQIMTRGFLDPNFPNYIRTATHLISIDQFIIKSVEKISGKSKERKEVIPTFFADYIKNNNLFIHEKVQIEGVSIDWVLEDLWVEGRLKEKIQENFIFNTRYFSYTLSRDYQVLNIREIDSEDDIASIIWNENNMTVHSLTKINSYNGSYIDWLRFLNYNKELLWPNFKSYPYKVDDIVDNLTTNWVIHPKVWKSLGVDTQEGQELYLHLFKEDWRHNALITHQKGSMCVMTGWRFTYSWDGFILESILAPNKDSIQKITLQDTELIINSKHKTSLTVPTPLLITDLVEGNYIRMLPKSSLGVLEFHEHAIQRYEERIDDKQYLCNMIQDVLENSYRSGIVVSGAHTNERRKVEADRYGYILSNQLVISVWDKTSNKKKKRKKKSNTIKHLEKIDSLFKSM